VTPPESGAGGAGSRTTRPSRRAAEPKVSAMAEPDEFQQLTPLIEGLLDAAVVIEPGSLRVLAVNSAAETLFGIEAAALCQADALELSSTAQDIAFWEQAASQLTEPMEGETLISRPDGQLVPVQRRVSLLMAGSALRNGAYLVVMRDRSEELRARHELEEAMTLDLGARAAAHAAQQVAEAAARAGDGQQADGRERAQQHEREARRPRAAQRRRRRRGGRAHRR